MNARSTLSQATRKHKSLFYELHVPLLKFYRVQFQTQDIQSLPKSKNPQVSGMPQDC